MSFSSSSELRPLRTSSDSSDASLSEASTLGVLNPSSRKKNRREAYLRVPDMPLRLMSFGVLSLAIIFAAVKLVYMTPGTCVIPSSRSSFTLHKIGVNTTDRRNALYNMYLYKQDGVPPAYSGPDSLGGTPVLFIPGNAGSHYQGRSLSSLAAEMPDDNQWGVKFDMFLLDFNEEFSAFHGGSIYEEALYTNDAIRQILDLYRQSSRDPSDVPQSVILLGHSMGGVVARTLITLPNYNPKSVNTIITLSTPHVAPPLPFDREISRLYDTVNGFWRDSKVWREGQPLEDTLVISVSGGHTDLLVPPSLSILDSVIPMEHQVSTHSYSVPHVWRGIDHLAIVWCADLRHTMISTLVAVADEKAPSRTLPLKDRRDAAAVLLQSSLDSINEPVKLDHFSPWQGFIHSDSDADDLQRIDTPGGELYLAVNKQDPSVSGPEFSEVKVRRSGLLRLLVTGIKQPLTSSMTTLRLPALQSSVMALSITIRNKHSRWASTEGLPIYVRHKSSPGESRWYSAGGKAQVMWYSKAPFLPANKSQSLDLQLMVPPELVADQSYEALIKIDAMATLANLGMYYRTAIPAFAFAITVACLLIQFWVYAQGHEVHYSGALRIFVQSWLPKLCIASGLLHIVLTLPGGVSILRSLAPHSGHANVLSLKHVPMFKVNEALVGIVDWHMFWVAPLLLVVSTVLCFAEHLLLVVSVRLIRAIARACNRTVRSLLRRKRNTAATTSVQEPATAQDKYISAAKLALTALTLYFVPYQVSFVASTIYMLVCTRATQSWSFTFLAAFFWVALVDLPVTAVFVRNFDWQWIRQFGAVYNIAAALPTVAWARVVCRTDSAAVPIGRAERIVTVLMLGFCVWYSIMWGAAYTYMIHVLANFISLWLCVLFIR